MISSIQKKHKTTLFWVKNTFKALFSVSVVILSGCAMSIPQPPKGQPTVTNAYQHGIEDNDNIGSGVEQTNLKSKAGIGINLPVLDGALQNPTILRAQAEDNKNFPMLPNPQVMVYIYPHVSDGLPIHGNWTTFSLYENNHYALPSEVNTGDNSYV